MPVSTATAALAVSTSAAASANTAAARMEAQRCKDVINNFTANGATVGQMQEYATCVDYVYPQQMGVEAVIFLKFLFVSAILGAIVAGWSESRSEYHVWSDVGIMALLGLVATPLLVLLISGIVYGCFFWLFT